jgi:spore coat protein A, manganese oxidase
MKKSRRNVLKVSALAGVSLMSWGAPRARAAIPGGTLSPGDVTKYQDPLVKPPAMPGKQGRDRDSYRIAVRQFQQQILPVGLPKTTVWGYGSVDHPSSFNYPSYTIEACWGKPTHVEWRNELVDAKGNYLPHLLPVDPTLHWANPPGGTVGRDSHPILTSTPGPYTGPVPMVTHVHGAHTREDSDGFAEAWYLPRAKNIPAGYAKTGTFYDYFKKKYGAGWAPGTSTFRYPNDQRASTLWYHDHTLGMTRVNVYAGPAGFYLLRGGPDDLYGRGNVLPGPAPRVGSNPFGEFGEIPIAIQDRSFNQNGSLFYPDSREFFDGYTGPFVPDSHIAPIWNPEFFGNMMVVNGRTWPTLNVQRKRYRFRLLNGCNARFLVLKLTRTPRTADDVLNTAEGDFWQIGADGGFLPKAAQQSALVMAPAERADVIVDFAQFNVGDEVYLVNDGPDEPFGGIPTAGLADWQSTGQVMKFIVGSGPAKDPSTHPSQLKLPLVRNIRTGATTVVQALTLNEHVHGVGGDLGEVPAAALLGRLRPDGTSQSQLWMDPITENPAVGEAQLWSLTNLTVDAHPIHLHQVQFQVVSRTPITGGTSLAGQNTPLPGELGFKDTVIAYPGEVTVVKAKFDIPGLFVWHCHIVEHEDNEMMRPFYVGKIPATLPRFV